MAAAIQNGGIYAKSHVYALSQVNRINPNHPACQAVYIPGGWKACWKRDPFLAYMDESDDLYYVRSQNYLITGGAERSRNVPEKYPPQRNHSRWPRLIVTCCLAVFGMILSGLGTLIICAFGCFGSASSPATWAAKRRSDPVKEW
jgi:hypothetical protein